MDKGDNVINKRTVYAIRALYELAQSQEYSSTTDAIAQARNISKKFLPQILSDLSRAGLVRTTRGFGEAEFRQIADWIIEVVDGLAAHGEDGNAAVEEKVKAEVAALCERFPLYPNL